MRIAVIGGRGQVARALADRRSAQLDVTLFGRPAIDLMAPEGMAERLRSAAPDIVVNAAAYTDVDRAEREPDIAAAVNAEGARLVAAVVADMGVPLIHLSTDYVFDGAKSTPYVETDKPAPLNAYGRSKLAGEQMVVRTTADCAILRTSWVYAPFGSNFLMTMLRIMTARDEVQVIADRYGAPTSAIDIAWGIETIARNMIAPGSGTASRGLFHMTAEGVATWAQFAEEIFACLHARGTRAANVVPISWRQYPEVARRPANSRLDNSRLAQVHGLALPHWKVALMRTMACLQAE